MKKVLNKKSMLITSVALLFLVAVGTTLAYVFTQTDPVENKFNPSKVSCAVVENGDSSENTANVVETGNSKTNVQIKNTGDTDAYIRAAVVVNWMSADGKKVWATKPVAGADYMITFNLSDGWVLGSDGYYYYTKAVPAVDEAATSNDETLTGVLINEAKLIGDAPAGYYLSIEIVASAIQADGMGATSAQDAWVKAPQSTSGNS